MENLRYWYSDNFLSTLSADEQTILEECYKEWSTDEGRDRDESFAEWVVWHTQSQITDDDMWEEIADDMEVDVKEFDTDRLAYIPVYRKLLGEERRLLDVAEAKIDAWQAAR